MNDIIAALIVYLVTVIFCACAFI